MLGWFGDSIQCNDRQILKVKVLLVSLSLLLSPLVQPWSRCRFFPLPLLLLLLLKISNHCVDRYCCCCGCRDHVVDKELYPCGSVAMWQAMDDGDRGDATLYWRSMNAELSVNDLSIQDVRGLNPLDSQLLKQRRA